MIIADFNNKVYNYYNNLIKARKLETKNILIDEKNYKDITIYFARYDHKKSTKTLSRMGKIENMTEKNTCRLMIVRWMEC